MDMPILIVCSDLIFSTKITGTIKALGRTFAVARTMERLKELLGAQGGTMVIVDLAVTGMDPLEAIRVAKSAGGESAGAVKVVAFLSHVQADLAAAAREAGADQVLARSAFATRLPEIVGGG
jgi:CheY-like chemotaxis protein